MTFTALTGTLTSAIPTVMAAGALGRTARWAKGSTRRRKAVAKRRPVAKRAVTRRKTTKRKAAAKKRR